MCAGKDFNYAEYFSPVRVDEGRAHHGSRLEKAKKLAIALLGYYYPKDQGYRVEPVEFPLLHFGGWRTWVFPEDCYAAPRRKSAKFKGPLKKKAVPVYETWGGNLNADKFHRILSEHITGYVVLNEVQYPDGSKGWAQHTYLAIMMDDLDTFQHWVPEELMSPAENYISMPRADILNDAMGVQAGISHGYAIIMLGPRIEFYNYKAKPAWEEKPWEYYLGPNETDTDYVPDLKAGADEISCFSRLDSSNDDSEGWVVDVRSKPLAHTCDAVDSLFRRVIGRDVHYRNGLHPYFLPGPKI